MGLPHSDPRFYQGLFGIMALRSYLHTVRLGCDFVEERKYMRSGCSLKPYARIDYSRYFYIANHSYQLDHSSHLPNHWRSITMSSIRLKSNNRQIAKKYHPHHENVINPGFNTTGNNK